MAMTMAAPSLYATPTPTPTLDQGGATKPPSKTIVMDPEGDLSVVVHGAGAPYAVQDFLVHSRVLALASPMFAIMFGPHFREGGALRGKTAAARPCRIDLHEDDPYAMDLLFRVLHHRVADMPLRLEPAALAALAVQADKYDCKVVFRPWALQWCCIPEGATQREIGEVLLAAYLLEAPGLEGVALQAARLLRPSFVSAWEDSHIVDLMPDAAIDWLADRIDDELDGVRESIQTTVVHLQAEKEVFDTPAVVCPACRYSTDHPWANMRCLKCSCRYERRQCTADVRVDAYLALLRACDLEDGTAAAADACLEDAVRRVTRLAAELRHKCFADACPLAGAVAELEALVRRRVDGLLRTSVDTGLVFRRG